MNKRYFTIEEADEMIPHLTEVFIRLVQLRAQILQIHQRLAEAGHIVEEMDLEKLPEGISETVVRDVATLQVLVGAFRKDAAQIQGTGCVIKGMDPPLVDWYARVDGRDVFLCWRFGERHVDTWHELHAGFAGRQDVDSLEHLEMISGSGVVDNELQ